MATKRKPPTRERAPARTDHDRELRDDADDARRLVLADELQQRGDPRGELIVVQCELARLPEVANRRRTELQLRSDDLVARHRARWLAHLPLTVKERTSVVFRRGLPVRVSLPVDRFLRVGEGLFEESSFSELGLTALGPLTKVSPASLARVARLDLEPTPAAARTGPRYVEGGQLRVLKAPALRERLRAFTAVGCMLTSAMKTVARAEGLQAVTSLDLSTTFIEDTQVAQLCADESFPQLRALALGGNRLTARSAEAIAKRGWPLETLAFGFGLVMNDLYGTAGQLESKGVEAVVSSGAFTGLRALAFENQLVDDAGAEALAKGRFERLGSLSLAANVIGASGLAALAASPVLGGLAAFDASLNPVHEAVDALAAAPMPSLVSLRLAATGMTDADLARLCRAPWVPNLVELDLSDNPLTDEGARTLAGAPFEKLAFLALRNTDVGARAAKTAADAHDLIVFET